MHACMHACMHAYIHTYTHTYIHTYTHTRIERERETHTHTRTHPRTHARTHACMHARNHTHAITHTHTKPVHAHKFGRSLLPAHKLQGCAVSTSFCIHGPWKPCAVKPHNTLKLSKNIDDGETVRLDGLQNKQATFLVVRCEHGSSCFMMLVFKVVGMHKP